MDRLFVKEIRHGKINNINYENTSSKFKKKMKELKIIMTNYLNSSNNK